MRKTLTQTLLAAFCAILLAAPLEGGGVMLIGMRNAMLAGGGSQPSGGYWGLCFTAEEAGAVVAMSGRGALASSVNLLYSTDPSNASSWTPFAIGTDTITLANIGDKVWFKAGPGGNTAMYAGLTNNVSFVIKAENGLVAASGSIMSLLNGEEETFTLQATRTFRTLFTSCTGLTAAPDLPATTLTDSCYAMMFYNCSSLTRAPVLHVDLVQNTPSGCYASIFKGCSSLESITVGFTAFNGTADWINGVAASGTFYCPTALGTNETIARNDNACPSGWTVVNTDA